ncbi:MULTISPECIES: hypothetical protein [Bacillus]|uniref:hypothetical protein n=1 Tax=Bacillus TaxID=1386 RepID=UPI00025A9B1D|nr:MULTISPECIES: hypothetical protein [Bacillus]AKQ71737.1 hypothetical protein MUY_000605 [Bacillus licheniformis WX-02]MCP8974414.1 hypothetical protein [Bacillus licheniformis]MCY8009731.1 hypothetical protein [Bacillus haynesii]MCY8567431.1 hypothetical protein [Bacillus haynesii]
MAKAITAPFSNRREDQQRLYKVGGSIVIDKQGRTVFSFPSMDKYREWQRLGAEAHKRKVGIV